jgi:hypothetical protein
MRHGYPVNAGRSFALICGNGSPGAPQIADIGTPIPQIAVRSFGVTPTPLIELSLHAEEPDLVGLYI